MTSERVRRQLAALHVMCVFDVYTLLWLGVSLFHFHLEKKEKNSSLASFSFFSYTSISSFSRGFFFVRCNLQASHFITMHVSRACCCSCKHRDTICKKGRKKGEQRRKEIKEEWACSRRARLTNRCTSRCAVYRILLQHIFTSSPCSISQWKLLSFSNNDISFSARLKSWIFLERPAELQSTTQHLQPNEWKWIYEWTFFLFSTFI